ncbi:alpha-2,8-sialyltransferase 8E-like isoform 2-T4 [Salvelinus alpinus]
MTTMKKVDIALFSQEVRGLMNCPWRLNLTHRELYRTELWSCCNASDRLMVTRQNTNQNQSLTYDAEKWRKRKVDQALWDMLPQTVPWSKGSLSRCAVVGSGGILQNSSCGAEIDNADYVIRFNLAPINKSYDVGVKTDLITANPSQINKSYSLVPSLQLPYGLGRGEGREPCVFQNTTPAKPHCFLTHCLLNSEARRTNLLEETPYSWQPKSLECDGTRTSRPAKPSPNPDDAGPIVRHLMGLPVTASCDTAWDRTQVCRPLRHLGGPWGP